MKNEPLDRKIKKIADKIRSTKLRRKIIALLESSSIEIAGKEYTRLTYEISPAGLSHHHSYPGGYMEHVVSSTEIAEVLCDMSEKIYHGQVNRDLVYAGILLHDAFKPYTYVVNDDGTYGSSSLADNLDHVFLGASEMHRRGFPLDLIHIVAAHHGNYGEIHPRTIEALICHIADSADSRLNGEVLRAARYLSWKATGQELHEATSEEAFEIVRSKTAEGWEGVRKALDTIERERMPHKT